MDKKEKNREVLITVLFFNKLFTIFAIFWQFPPFDTLKNFLVNKMSIYLSSSLVKMAQTQKHLNSYSRSVEVILCRVE